jgi:hypothetical protein
VREGGALAVYIPGCAIRIIVTRVKLHEHKFLTIYIVLFKVVRL